MSKHVLQLWVAEDELPQDIRGALDGGNAFPEGTQYFPEAHHSMSFLWLGGFVLFVSFFALMLLEYPGAFQERAFNVVGGVIFSIVLFGGALGCLHVFLKQHAVAMRAKKEAWSHGLYLTPDSLVHYPVDMDPDPEAKVNAVIPRASVRGARSEERSTSSSMGYSVLIVSYVDASGTAHQIDLHTHYRDQAGRVVQHPEMATIIEDWVRSSSRA